MTEMNRREFLQWTGRGAFLAGATVAGLSMHEVANATSKERKGKKMNYKGTTALFPVGN